MVEKGELLKERVGQMELDRISSVRDLMEAYADSSIQSRALARCARVLEGALLDEARPTVILGLSGPLIAGGLRKVIADLVREGVVDVIVSTGAIPYQDLFNARGYHHYKCSPLADDIMLWEHRLNRIYDTLVDETVFRENDAYIEEVAASIEPRGYSSREFMEILGSRIEDEDSILVNAVRLGVPLYVPALNDSSIGIALTDFRSKRMRRGDPFPLIDAIRDNHELRQIALMSEKTAAIYIGGGVPKNFIQQVGWDRGGHDYALQITADVPQWGGLSGCTLEEAQSWGKITPDANKAVAYVEVTIGLSLLAGYIFQKEVAGGRDRLRFVWNGEILRGIERHR